MSAVIGRWSSQLHITQLKCGTKKKNFLTNITLIIGPVYIYTFNSFNYHFFFTIALDHNGFWVTSASEVCSYIVSIPSLARVY